MERLVRRADFLAAAAGRRAGAPTFTLQARARADETSPRVGLTVTKRAGTAVERNRIKRRLRAALRETVPMAGRPGFDYVILARRETISRPFALLKDDLSAAFARAHRDKAAGGPTRNG
jgi:ribonuclease P protein component